MLILYDWYIDFSNMDIDYGNVSSSSVIKFKIVKNACCNLSISFLREFCSKKF
jgi:hypothetical protein